MKIAIIGSGISGLASAFLLKPYHEITLFEKNSYLGGHSNTVEIDYLGKKIAVDTGFIVFNFKTYPNLKALFELLDVKIDKSNMSFGIKDFDSNLEYCGANLGGLFAQKSNLLKPQFLKMLKDIVTFNKSATNMVLSQNISEDLTLLQFVDNLKLGKYFKDYYLFPMAAAIWSCPLELMYNYPAKTFLQFFHNHGLLTILSQPQWYTVSGGSREYVKKISANFKDNINLNCQITKAKSENNKVILTDNKGVEHVFDHVIFASHGDQSYQIIKDKTIAEEKILSKIKYSQNIAILHKDSGQMPDSRKAWASWIYLSSKKQNKVSLTYHMNNLQNINQDYPLFVTLNPIKEIKKEDIFVSINYEHPIFDFGAIESQENLEQIQGKRNMWFCGAWTKYGFHEDGLSSAIKVAKQLGAQIPWEK